MAAPDWLPTYVRDGHELVATYQDFWKRVTKIASKPVRPKSLEVKPAREIEGESLCINIGQTEPLAILGVPSGGVRGAKAFDIYNMSGTQIVRKAKGEYENEHVWITVKSVFQVLYLNALEDSVTKKEWKKGTKVSHAYVGYQFYVETGSHCRAHFPDCHVRYTLDAIPEESIQRLYKDDDDSWAFRAGHGQPIVPSAPLDLAGLLYMVLHQHDRSKVVSGWPREHT